MKVKLIKIYRFILLYGISRTLVKAASRAKKPLLRRFLIYNYRSFSKKRSISLIGCGQFGFATISYFLLKNRGKVFLDCYDIDSTRSEFLSQFYGYNTVKEIDKVFENESCQLVYIASNHHSHTEYAIKAIKENLDVYIEKPISVTNAQFSALTQAINSSSSNIYAGYNRPFSKAVRLISKRIEQNNKPISLGCFISGHSIDQDHWYRDPQEGTRICGNVGHWIDLMVHLMYKRGRVPKKFTVNIAYSNPETPDDDISISISSDLADITNILITSRTEPFEGINETINFQSGDLIAKIDDFQKVTLWENDKKSKHRFFPKDVGHSMAINQPFLNKGDQRDWIEVEISTTIMLFITNMVLKKTSLDTIEIS